MSRPSSMIRTASLLALSIALSACGTPYTRMFSPRLSYYEKPPEKVSAGDAALLEAPTTAPDAGGSPSTGGPPPAPAPAPAPGLDAAPSAIPGL